MPLAAPLAGLSAPGGAGRIIPLSALSSVRLAPGRRFGARTRGEGLVCRAAQGVPASRLDPSQFSQGAATPVPGVRESSPSSPRPPPRTQTHTCPASHPHPTPPFPASLSSASPFPGARVQAQPCAHVPGLTGARELCAQSGGECVLYTRPPSIAVPPISPIRCKGESTGPFPAPFTREGMSGHLSWCSFTSTFQGFPQPNPVAPLQVGGSQSTGCP